MKKIVLPFAILFICALTFGCTQKNDDKIYLENMNAQEILEALSFHGYPNDAATMYTEKGSVNGYPWSIKGCTSAVNWTITLGNEGEDSASGIIEVFNNATNCTARKNSAEGLSSFYSPEQDYFVQEGAVFMQIPFALTPNEAAQFEAALKAMAQGEAPKTYKAEALNARSLWVGYTETFPKYVYKGTKDATFANRHFLLKDNPQNKAEELVALNFYYNIAGMYDNLYNLCGSESLQISAKNSEKNFKEGNYVQKYQVNQLSILTFDEFTARDSSNLEMTKMDVEVNKLMKYTLVRADFTMTSLPGKDGAAELSDGEHTFYFLCGKSQADDDWKIYQIYWE